MRVRKVLLVMLRALGINPSGQAFNQQNAQNNLTTSTILNLSEALISEAKTKFSVGPEFLQSILSGLLPGKNLSEIKSLHQLTSSFPEQKKSISYALATNNRGKQLVERVTHLSGITRGRYLDIGSAYSGSVLAFKNAGFDALGIEIVPYFYAHGQKNLKDHGKTNLLINGDFLEYNFSNEQFDVITCSDVIEHVNDPIYALKKGAALVPDGGLFHLYIPNKDCLRNVEKDIHYHIFGMNLLPHHMARYLNRLIMFPEYSIGEFFELNFYTRILTEAGMTVSVTDKDPVPFEQAGEAMASLEKAQEAWREDQAQQIDHFLREEIEKRLAIYWTDIRQAFQTASTPLQQEAFVTKYLTSVWEICARKHP